MTSLEIARGKMNVAYQSLINAKTLIFNKMRQSDYKTFPSGTADIYDKELDRIRDDYYKGKNEMMEFCDKIEVEKDCASVEREFQYQYLEAKEKVMEIRNNEDKLRPSTSGSAMMYSSSGTGNPYFLKCDSCYSATQKVNVSFKCELCSKNLGSMAINME